MTIVKLLDDIKEWLEAEVCKNLEFKRPPENDKKDGPEYEYELIKPKAFIMYPPPSEKLPSVTVQYGNGNHSSGELEIRLLFATWSPGIYYKEKDVSYEQKLMISNEGWRDVWNFIDYTLRKLSNADYIGQHIRIKKESAITYGPMMDQDVIASYYPHWCGWIKLTIQYGVSSTNEDYIELLG